ncbi:hypothetical protein S83_013248, partial [Arachis hypogaea]
CGYHAEIGIATLIDKSLLTITNDDECGNILGMHDLLEDMGKYIVKQESPNDLSQRSRLWSYEDVDRVLTQNKLLKKLEHLNLSNCCKLRQTTDLSGVPNLKTFHLGQCKELNYIHPSLAHHKSLVELDLWGCESLER